jgi:hypothetical protein
MEAGRRREEEGRESVAKTRQSESKVLTIHIFQNEPLREMAMEDSYTPGP